MTRKMARKWARKCVRAFARRRPLQTSHWTYPFVAPVADGGGGCAATIGIPRNSDSPVFAYNLGQLRLAGRPGIAACSRGAHSSRPCSSHHMRRSQLLGEQQRTKLPHVRDVAARRVTSARMKSTEIRGVLRTSPSKKKRLAIAGSSVAISEADGSREEEHLPVSH